MSRPHRSHTATHGHQPPELGAGPGPARAMTPPNNRPGADRVAGRLARCAVDGAAGRCSAGLAASLHMPTPEHHPPQLPPPPPPPIGPGPSAPEVIDPPLPGERPLVDPDRPVPMQGGEANTPIARHARGVLA